MFQTTENKRALAVLTAGAVMLSGILPASAAPVMAGGALKEAAPDQSVDVRWRGRGAVFGGVAAGLAIGAIAAAASRPRYYAPGYAYAQPYYAPPVVYAPPPAVYYEPEPTYYAAPAPTYYAPPAFGSGPVRQCWVANDERGYGYWRPC